MNILGEGKAICDHHYVQVIRWYDMCQHIDG